MIFFNLFCVLEDRQQSRTQVQSSLMKNSQWWSKRGQMHRLFAETNQENIKEEHFYPLKNIKIDFKKDLIMQKILRIM